MGRTRRSRRLTIIVCAAGLCVVVGAWGSLGSNPSRAATDAVSATSGKCKPKHRFKTLKAGALTVATFSSLPNSDVQGGKMGGVDGQIVNAIAKRECLRVSVQELPPPALLPAVTTGRVDLSAAGWNYSAERAQQVNFTTRMYRSLTGVVSKNGAIRTVDQLNGQTVGVVQGGLYVEPLQQLIGNDHVRLYQSFDAVWQDLASGRLDVALAGYAEMRYGVQQRPSLGMKAVALPPSKAFAPSLGNHVGMIYRKGKTALGAALNKDIAYLLKSGRIQKILNKYGLGALHQ